MCACMSGSVVSAIGLCEHARAARSARRKKRFSKLIFWITNYKSFLVANPLESVKPRRKR